MKYPLRDDRDKEFEEAPEEVEGEEDAERRGIPGDLIWVQDQVGYGQGDGGEELMAGIEIPMFRLQLYITPNG